MYILAAISFSFNFGLTLMLIFFLLLCDLFTVYIRCFLFVMILLPHNLLVLIFLSALFLFICFFADFLINLPKYKYIYYRNVLNIELSTYETVTYGKTTLPVNGAKLFNSLGNEFKNGLNYSEFKAKLKTWCGEEC